MPFPRRLLTDDEEIIREFRQHWRLLLIPIFWVVAAAVAIYLVYRFPPDDPTVDLVTAIIIGVAAIALGVRPLVGWWFTWYVLTNERLITRSGVIARDGIDIPLENINNVIFSQTVIERLLGCGDLVVESAGATGQSHFANIREPDQFQALLYATREQRTRALDSGGHSAVPVRHDADERLRRLSELHRDGMISDEEFVAKRQALLDEM